MPVSGGFSLNLAAGPCKTPAGDRAGIYAARFIPVIDAAVSNATDEVLAKIVLAPDTEGFATGDVRGGRPPRPAGEEARAPARSGDNRVNTGIDLVRGYDRAPTVPRVRGVCRDRGSGGGVVRIDAAGDLGPNIPAIRRGVTAQRNRAGKCHKVSNDSAVVVIRDS